jgi:8-oxo-dGTP pyrophosphatase MutT (NUDIX family)
MTEFKKSPNILHADENGRKFWESRSCAAVVVVLGIHKETIFTLVEKRSKIMDAPGLWAVPSGYLDWGETGWEAAKREIWEETGFDCDKFKTYLISDNDEQPFFVNTEPTENHQNVALVYCIIYDFNNALPLFVEDFKNFEVDEIRWIPIEEVEHYEWAFLHDVRIEQAVEKFKKYLI